MQIQAPFVRTHHTRDSAAPAAVTALQQHVGFFDRDKDGRITVSETYRGCRALGYGRILSAGLGLIINAGLGWPTAGYPTLTIDVGAIHRGKHGSDTDVYDMFGRFQPEQFEWMFALYDRDGDGALNVRELWHRARGDRDLFDLVGQIISLSEFGLLFLIAAEDWKLSKRTLRGFYDGSLFYELQERRARRPHAC